jgi:hypothetical protein
MKKEVIDGKEERMLMVFEKSVLRKIFWSKREGVTGGWIKLHEDLHNAHSASNVNRVIKLKRG